MTQPKYVLSYDFEWGGGCLWSANDAAFRAFGFGPLDLKEPCQLPLSAETRKRCVEIAIWHDTSLNWDYPPDPGPWRQPECDRFNAAVRELHTDIERELGEEFEIVSHQLEAAEDPRLDAFLEEQRSRRGEYP
jgi:hypothetical protein